MAASSRCTRARQWPASGPMRWTSMASTRMSGWRACMGSHAPSRWRWRRGAEWRGADEVMSATNLPLSGERLWDSLMEMAKIGGTLKGGCNRQTLTDLDAEGRALFRRWGEACGLTLTVDRLGNMVFRREGRDPTRRPVAFG